MNKNFRILLIILLNGWNNFSNKLEKNPCIKLKRKNQILIKESISFTKKTLYSDKIKNNFLDLNDKRCVMLPAFGFVSILSLLYNVFYFILI